MGNELVSGGPQVLGPEVGPICHIMDNEPPIKFDHLHVCDNGPLRGRYITVHRGPEVQEVINIAEMYVWDSPQPEDQSPEHGELVGPRLLYSSLA